MNIKNKNNFADQVKKEFKQHFPNGHIGISETKMLSRHVMYIRMGLIENEKDTINGIRDNDQIFTSFCVESPDFDDLDNFATEKLTITQLVGGAIAIKPTPDESHLVMSMVKVPFRKINDRPDKAVESLGKYFKNFRVSVEKEKIANNIYCQDKIKDIYLEIPKKTSNLDSSPGY